MEKIPCADGVFSFFIAKMDYSNSKTRKLLSKPVT
jgi:hypothetical protein